MDLQHVEDRLQGNLQVRDGVKQILIGTVEGKTNLSNIVEGNTEGELFESIVLDAQTEHVYMQRVGRLVGFPDLGKGLIDGTVTVGVTPNDWLLDANLIFSQDSLGKA